MNNNVSRDFSVRCYAKRVLAIGHPSILSGVRPKAHRTRSRQRRIITGREGRGEECANPPHLSPISEMADYCVGRDIDSVLASHDRVSVVLHVSR